MQNIVKNRRNKEMLGYIVNKWQDCRFKPNFIKVVIVYMVLIRVWQNFSVTSQIKDYFRLYGQYGIY